MVYNVTGTILPTIYAKYYAVDLAFIGSVLMVSRIFDAMTDPVIGFLSDRTNTFLGRRKPWLLAGSALLPFAVYRLFVPPDTGSGMHFMVWFVLLYLFLTIIEIPSLAWLAEITRNYRIRSRVVGFRIAFYNAGGLLFALLPLLPIFETNEMTPAVMKALALIIMVLLPVLTLIAVVFAPQGKPVSTKASGTMRTLLRDMSGNKPFLIFSIAFLFIGLAQGMQQVLGILYFETYLKIGNIFPIILSVMFLTQFLSIPVWLRLMNNFGRHRALAVGSALSVIVSIGLSFLKPNPSYFLFFIIWVSMIFLMASVFLAPPAIMGDIIDYDTLNSGRDQGAQYYAVYNMIVKFNNGIGGGLGFFIVDMFDYDVSADVHNAASTMGIIIAVVIVPSILYFIGAMILWRFPIDERKQGIIRRGIERRLQNAQLVLKQG
ncbi:MAG: MFS transporter [Deltaproteobacteria bacterium]|nr:MFS transporter [Deltaproteobacteria bacterium]